MPRKKSYKSEFPDLDKSYRRGLILGLSLAEVFLLLVFLLLLVAVGYAGLVQEEKKQKEEQVEIGKEVKKQYPNILPEEVEDLFIILKENLVNDKNIDKQLEEIFKKIEQLEAEIQRLLKENKELKKYGDNITGLQNLLSEKNEEITALKLELNKLKKEKEKLEAELAQLKILNSALKSRIANLEEKIKELKALINQNLAKLIDDLRVQIEKLEKDNNKLEKKVDDLENENSKDRDVQEELSNLVGNGTQKIACWTKYDEKLGRLRSLNIFDVLINNNGILIYDRKKHKFLNQNQLNERKNKIPMSQIKFNKTLSVNNFLFQTESMYRHGLDKKGYFSALKEKYLAIPCLYNIQVYDKTTNDSIYRKIIERGLSQRFNFIILRDEEWPH
jgi:hypothetical protein